MSNGAMGDPEAIRAFAQVLRQFCESTRENLSSIRGQLHEMGNSTWRDSVYREYLSSFEEVAGQIDNVIERIETEQPSFLDGCAQRLEEYLNGSG